MWLDGLLLTGHFQYLHILDNNDNLFFFFFYDDLLLLSRIYKTWQGLFIILAWTSPVLCLESEKARRPLYSLIVNSLLKVWNYFYII